jgi:hypothetical protein
VTIVKRYRLKPEFLRATLLTIVLALMFWIATEFKGRRKPGDSLRLLNFTTYMMPP